MQSTADVVMTGRPWSKAGMGDHISATCSVCGRVGGVFFPGKRVDKFYRWARIVASGWEITQLEGDHFYCLCPMCSGQDVSNRPESETPPCPNTHPKPHTDYLTVKPRPQL